MAQVTLQKWRQIFAFFMKKSRNADIEVYSKRIPGYERSRGVFKTQIRLKRLAALYRVVERIQEFSLIDSKADIKGRAFQKVLAPAIRAGMGQYFTPDPIVELAVGVIKPKAHELILDPFCGSGHFLDKNTTTCHPKIRETRLPSMTCMSSSFSTLHGIEKSDRMVRIAMTDMMLNDDGHTNITKSRCSVELRQLPRHYSRITPRFLRKTHQTLDPAVFDVVLTNPPFGSIMRQETMEMLGSL
jgi:type I restriction enzyme M protein